jgi:hypothetical protein
MSKTNDSPAFPSANNVRAGDIVTGGHSGMSLRDYFAAKAANGLCSNPVWLQESFNTVGSDEAVNFVAAAAYELADAMLEARSK